MSRLTTTRRKKNLHTHTQTHTANQTTRILPERHTKLLVPFLIHSISRLNTMRSDAMWWHDKFVYAELWIWWQVIWMGDKNVLLLPCNSRRSLMVIFVRCVHSSLRSKQRNKVVGQRKCAASKREREREKESFSFAAK